MARIFSNKLMKCKNYILNIILEIILYYILMPVKLMKRVIKGSCTQHIRKGVTHIYYLIWLYNHTTNQLYPTINIYI